MLHSVARLLLTGTANEPKQMHETNAEIHPQGVHTSGAMKITKSKKADKRFDRSMYVWIGSVSIKKDVF